MRQVRVTSGGCRGPSTSDGSPCYASFEDAPAISTQAFGPDNRWEFSNAGRGSHWGSTGILYPEQGHRAFMPRCISNITCNSLFVLKHTCTQYCPVPTTVFAPKYNTWKITDSWTQRLARFSSMQSCTTRHLAFTQL